MAISISRAKAAKESSAIGKATRGPPPNSRSPRESSRDHKGKTSERQIPGYYKATNISERQIPGYYKATNISERQIPSYYKAKTSERQIPSYVTKPKTSSRSEFQSQPLKQLKKDAVIQKPSVNSRRPSVEKPASKPKAKELSSSRPHKALVSAGPPHKTSSLLRTSTSTPSLPRTTISSKPISKTASKTPMAAKPKPIWSKKGTGPKKTAPTTRKKVVNAPVNSANTPQCSDAAAETSRPGTLPPVTGQEVEKVSEVTPHVDSTGQHEQQHTFEPHQPHIQADDERAIPSVPEGETVGEPKEEKTRDEQGRHPEEQQATDGSVEVKEKGKEEGGVIKDEESENNNEEKTLKEKEGEEPVREDKTDHDELVPKSEVEEVKTESTPPKEEPGNESQACVNVIEETASKLLETRKNKVLALAGAFQSVIDHQTTSK